MPKAPATAPTARPALRRNQACLSCRKRKLKCDAARPHCTTCVKAWQSQISVPPPVGYAHPTEPQCSYDPVDGLPMAANSDPGERIRMLEDQISQLKSQLHESRNGTSRSISPSHYVKMPSTSSHNGRTPDDSPTAGGIVLPHASLDVLSHLSPQSSDSRPGSVGSPEVRHHVRTHGLPDPLMDMLFSGWDPDLPDPDTLDHYIDVFFKCDPCGSRVLHQPTLMASLHLHPKDENYPHPAILHAICASASRWTSQDVITLPDGTRRDKFADLHVSKTRAYIDRTMATGQDIFPVMQACIILSWYFYQEGRWVEVWIFAGFQTRAAVPLRLNYPGTFSTIGAASPGAYLAPPRDNKDLESRRRTWWMTIMFDRIASVGGWVHAIDERDIGTELPLRRVDFEHDPNPQHLQTENVFTRHLPLFTDSFLLFLKAIMMFGKVTDYNTRSNLNATSAPSKNQNPFVLRGFEDLDRLVTQEFLQNFPSEFKHLGISDDGGALDTDLYMAHIVPHAAAITLHNPYLNFSDPMSVSTSRCVTATRSILAAYYRLSETSLDIPTQLCKYFIEIGDTQREQTVWGEINALRFAMLTYGSRSPIGTRQEKLLQGLMTEIVRMTSQMQPLEVGVPLYPFSHASLFPKDTLPQDPTAAPLPDSTQYPDSSESPSGLTGMGATSPTVTVGNWLSPSMPTMHPRVQR
ncbi:uncharacterized protein BXZ73DRAFT_87019 [Epithele typhae]|uniref:uncharacterized protein n=1 Tax=Epithele typhae TaxID=378194 RepID=UPI00200754B0|nr:uncharacterized protein BXZ73DRAFT_87019 [Epithele typhae]KAH9944047.1 hypothetical protein BXZ73DRAFT_87019 [Epithele typhae]